MHSLPRFLSGPVTTCLVLMVWAAVGLAQTRPRVEAEVITVTSRGFEPREITRGPGRILLVVNNRSGLREVWLKVDGPSGNRLNETRVRRERLDWLTFMDLEKGTYVVSEGRHPNWILRINVR